MILKMKEFKVNNYISLKLEKGNTNIYVNGSLFNQCKYVLVRKTFRELDDFLEDIESIDELAEHLDDSLGEMGLDLIDISEKTRYWVHCSNMQVWAENSYDTRLLHSNLAFPLLKKLSEIGDPVAQNVFIGEILKRFKECEEKLFLNTIKYLIVEGYLKSLGEDNLKCISIILRNILYKLTLKEKYDELILLLSYQILDFLEKDDYQTLLDNMPSESWEVKRKFNIIHNLKFNKEIIKKSS